MKRERIEVCLERMKVVEWRGGYNKKCEFDDEIVKVMKKNIGVIGKGMWG